MTTNDVEADMTFLSDVLEGKKPPILRAAAPKTPDRLNIEARAVVSFEAADATPVEGAARKRPTFTITAYTGGPMNVGGFFSPVIIDLGGLKASRDRIPILFGHDSTRIVGMTDEIAVGEDVRLSGTITGDNADANEVVSQARNGFEWQASVGASIVRSEFLKAGEKTTVNGREVSGPLLIAREARLHETSFVAIGADHQTSAAVAASQSLGTLKGEHSMFEQWLQAKGFDPTALDDTQKASLKAAYDAEEAAKVKAKEETKPDPRSTQSLDDIVQARRAEDGRIADITRIAGEAIEHRPMMLEDIEKLAKAAIEAKSTIQEFELQILRLRASAPVAPFSIHSRDDRAKAGPKLIEAALCMAGGLNKIDKHFDQGVLSAAADRFPGGLGLRDVLVIAARENGHPGHFSGNDVRPLLQAAFGGHIRAQGWSTLSLPGILSNTANKFLVDGFNAVESTWREISARRSVRDFKAISSYSLTGGFKYEKVGPGGELKHATVGETSYSNQAETYGKMFAITRTDLINDDLGALTQVPQRLGRGAALALNEVFWTEFMDNASFFTTALANYIEGAATNLQSSSLTTGETTFMDQTDPDGFPVAITPRILLVPNALAVPAATLINSTMIAGDTTANTLTFASNPHAGKFRVVQSSYLSSSAITGNSTKAWYLLADPSDLAAIEVAFLNGRDTPIVESADADFNVLGVQFRGYHDFGVNKQEYRAGFKSKGEA